MQDIYSSSAYSIPLYLEKIDHLLLAKEHQLGNVLPVPCSPCLFCQHSFRTDSYQAQLLIRLLTSINFLFACNRASKYT